MLFKPMLSGKAPTDLSKIGLPVLLSPKLDGIRAIMRDGGLVSRNLKPIPNEHIQDMLAGLPPGLDGELICGNATDKGVMQATASGVMARAGKPSFKFHIFDYIDRPFRGFLERLKEAAEIVESITDKEVRECLTIVPHIMVRNLAKLKMYEERFVQAGYEGVMLRHPNGPYKYGRSTPKEGGLLKVKRWEDAEAAVVGVVEEMHNTNDATKDELGRTKRSSSKEGKVGKGTLGALVCEIDRVSNVDGITNSPVQFEIGTGFTAAQRQELWDAWHAAGKSFPGRGLVKFKYQELTKDGVPRFPVFIDFRDPIDA